MDTKTYDFKQVSVSIGGNLITGFAEGDDAIKVTPDADDWSLSVGADGEASRSKSNNAAATVVITLKQTSDANDVLMGLRNLDRATGKGAVPVFIKDSSGRALHSSDKGWIQKLPEATYGANAGNREWTLRCGEMVHNIGGNV